MTNQHSESRPGPELPHPRLAGCFAVTVFVVASVFWLGVLSIGMAVLWGLLPGEEGGPVVLESAFGLAVATILQTVGMLAIVFAICRLWGRDLTVALGLRGMPRSLAVVATVSGLAASLFSGWVAQSVARLWPWFGTEHLTGLAELLLTDPLPGRLALIFMVLVVAPFAEEVIFRGFLWHAIEDATTPVVAWALTSLLFAAYHIDPLQAVSILPMGLFLGWLRLKSRSIRPAVLCHFSHNALGVSMCLWRGVDFEVQLGPLGLFGIVVGLLGAGICAHRLGSVQFSGRGRSRPVLEASIDEP